MNMAEQLPLINGDMTCDFHFFLTVFQSYQENEWVIMKGCVQWILASDALPQLGTAISAGQLLTH